MEGFGGLRVVSFESRRAEEMARLVERHGGVAIRAPSMREVPLGDDSEAAAFARAVMAGEIDVLVLMTGVGTRALVRAITPVIAADAFRDLLASGSPVVVARGPKPVAALRDLGVTKLVAVPEPNTWRDILATLDARQLAAGKRITVQEYGVPTEELYAALETRGARVSRVPVYTWALPEDTGPLRAALRAIAGGDVDVVLFTSRAQLDHALIVARQEGIEDAFRSALSRMVVGSIGPVCSAALRAEGVRVDVEPTHPKMGHLVKETAERAGSRSPDGRSGRDTVT